MIIYDGAKDKEARYYECKSIDIIFILYIPDIVGFLKM